MIAMVVLTVNLNSIAKRNVSQDVIAEVNSLRNEVAEIGKQLKQIKEMAEIDRAQVQEMVKVDREIITKAERFNHYLKKASSN